MTSLEAASRSTSGTARSRRTHRAFAVGAAIVAPGLIWLAATAAGADLMVDMRDGQPAEHVGLPLALGFAAQAALLGWLTLAVLERFTRRAVPIWTGLACLVLLVSFVPVSTVGASAGTRTALALMHLAVAGPLIPVLRRTSPHRSSHT